MPLHMLDQMIRADKRTSARAANKLFLARMCALVSTELIAARENLVTAGERAVERSLAGVHAVVRLQMGQFVVALITARVVAGERLGSVCN